MQYFLKDFRYILLILLFSVSSCKTSDKFLNNISCNGDLTIQWDRKVINENPRADKKSHYFQVIFLSDFNERIKGYVNDKLVFDEYVKIGADSHKIDRTFGYNYQKDFKTPVLKVESIQKGTCFDIKIDKSYKIIYLFIDENGKWIVRFSNEYYLN
ncbi:hypothetical protein JM79_2154 [Gramella sp. Hel_I_59]|nr:hypothetical protein JM79_2154 [Gramella sp. Hel_I_59]